MPLCTTNAVNTPSLWSISTANKLRHSLGFPSYPFSGKIPLASAGGIFLAIRAGMWYNRIANNPGWQKRAIPPKRLLRIKPQGSFFKFFYFFELTFQVKSVKIIVWIMQETHNRVSSETPYYQICWMAKCCPAFLKVRCIFYARNLEESHYRAVF